MLPATLRSGTSLSHLALIGLLSVALAIPIGLAPASNAQAAGPLADDPACAPYALVPLRGSGETKASPTVSDGMDAFGYADLKTSGSEGSTLRRALQALEVAAIQEGVSLSGLPVLNVGAAEGYPAVPVGQIVKTVDGENQWDLDVLGMIVDSARLGAVAVDAQIAKFDAAQDPSCPQTRFVLLGYSQGAMAARMAWANDRAGRIASIFAVGDPFQRNGAFHSDLPGDGVQGGGALGEGLLSIVAPYVGVADAELLAFDRSDTPRHSYCHRFDPICAQKSTPVATISIDISDHTNYLLDPAEARGAGSWLFDQVRDSGTPLERGGLSGDSLEVMLALDMSLGGERARMDALTYAAGIERQLLRHSSTARYGIVTHVPSDATPVGQAPTALLSPPVLTYAELQAELSMLDAAATQGKFSSASRALHQAVPAFADRGAHRVLLATDYTGAVGTSQPSGGELYPQGLNLPLHGHRSSSGQFWLDAPISFYGVSTDPASVVAFREVAPKRDALGRRELIKGSAYLDSRDLLAAGRIAPSASPLSGGDFIGDRIAADIMRSPSLKLSYDEAPLATNAFKVSLAGSRVPEGEGQVSCAYLRVGASPYEARSTQPGGDSSASCTFPLTSPVEYEMRIRLTDSLGASVQQSIRVTPVVPPMTATLNKATLRYGEQLIVTSRRGDGSDGYLRIEVIDPRTGATIDSAANWSTSTLGEIETASLRAWYPSGDYILRAIFSATRTVDTPFTVAPN